ncbi:DJ-1/PfpI family protein [Kitasatospora sp. NPDC094015]|uniref:DJ-1/PfpI family protein n=1 Tax=Kitasatospora sp. NPDC094015 TaxID=3155205 RepID=UPI003321BD71
MQIAILLYDGFTALDAVGPYEVLSRLPGAEVRFTAARSGPVRADTGALALVADHSLTEVRSADILLLPGGPGQTALMSDEPLLDWIRTVDATTTWTTSVCTGSLLLAAAGLLAGRTAASHWLALDQLPTFGATPSTDRTVVDGKYATSAGVSAGIDLALLLAGRIAGDRTAQAIQLLTEYAPEPPYQAGTPATAPADLVADLRERASAYLTA